MRQIDKTKQDCLPDFVSAAEQRKDNIIIKRIQERSNHEI